MRVLLALILVLFSANVFAEDNATSTDDATPITGLGEPKRLLENWEFKLGTFSFIMPKHDGSKSMRFLTVPLMTAKYRKFITLRYTGVSVAAPVPYTDFKLFASLTFNYDFIGIGVNNFDEVEYGVIIAPSLTFMPVKQVIASADFIKTVGGSESLEIKLSAMGIIKLTDRLTVMPSAFLIYGDANWMDLHFGVSAAESAEYRLPQFKPSDGLTRTGLTTIINYRLSTAWSWTTIISTEFLLNDSIASPTTHTPYVPRLIMMFSVDF